jgi:hypothetical protein
MTFKNLFLLLALTVATSLMMVESAVAGPPFFTDDPEPVELHN